MLLITSDVRPGIQECHLDLTELHPDKHDRVIFKERWSDFCRSDKTDPGVYTLNDNDTLTYFSESLIPIETDERPPLLLLLGNPASHSVSAGMCFAFEGNRHEQMCISWASHQHD